MSNDVISARRSVRQQEVGVRLVERRAVDVAPACAAASRVSPGRPMTRLMKSRSGSSGYLKTTTSPRGDRPHRQQRALEGARRRREDELVDEQVVADEQVGLHRAGRDLEGLDDEGADEQRQDDRDDDRLEVLASGGLRGADGVASAGVLVVVMRRADLEHGQEGLLRDLDACRPASCASCLPSASRAACACARCRRRSTWRARSCACALTVSRAMMRPPIAAWIATSNICRGISSRILAASSAPARVGRVAVHDDRQRVDRLAVHQDVELDERRRPSSR